MDKPLNKKIVITKIIISIICVVCLIVFLLTNKKGINTLKPIYSIIIIILTLLSTGFLIFSFWKLKNDVVNYYAYQVNDLFFMVIIAVVIVQIIFTFIFFPAQVVQTSMYPTLDDGQFVISNVNNKNIERFDIVIVGINDRLNDESGGLLKDNEFIVKRVIGLPGDTVYYDNNQLYINGEVVDEYFLNDDVVTNNYYTYKETKLGENEYLLLGDHRSSSMIDGVLKPGSYDSRIIGPILKDEIIGKVMYKHISFFKWEKVK